MNSQELRNFLQHHGKTKIDCRSINLVGAEIWLTNPYDIDVGFYQNHAEGCRRILERISADCHEQEWGTL